MIKIVTVYNSLNPGSFFQATSLYSVIQERYGNVEFYNTKSRNTYLSGMKLFVKLLAKGKIGSAFAQLKMAHQYACRVKQFRQTREAGENDIYILGADEIWNVSRKKMAKYPVFWGEGLDQKRCIAYAPSLNNAGQADLEKYAYVHEALDKLWAISVRDLNSKEILSTFTDRQISLVCDPVLLRPMEDYRKYQKQERDYRYILVYGPETHFSEEDRKKIVAYAKKNNCKLLAYYFYHNWVDEICYGDPYRFLELIDSAEYVFTSTFHGTMFSIMYNKRFVVFGENTKVQESLKQFGLLDKRYTSGSIEDVVCADYHYEVVNDTMKEMARDSKAYLFHSIDSLMDC